MPAGFARHVAEALPAARQQVLADCGHVPQVELPDATNSMIAELIEANSAPAPVVNRSHGRRSRARARGILGKVAALSTR